MWGGSVRRVLGEVGARGWVVLPVVGHWPGWWLVVGGWCTGTANILTTQLHDSLLAN